jgi:hypothetical protein
MLLPRPIQAILAVAAASPSVHHGPARTCLVPVAPAAAVTHDLTTAPGKVQHDTLTIDITNNMPHPMELSYGPDSARVALGRVDGGGERTVTLRNTPCDSVTLWAINDEPPHKLSHTFSTHAKATLSWTF